MQIFGFLMLFLTLSLTSVKAETSHEADKSAVRILAYFMIAQDFAPEANIRIEQFEEHLNTLARGSYNVMALPDILDAWNNNKELPPKTIAITFDGGHKSILTYAAPLLEKHQFPYTVFIAPDRTKKNLPTYLNWDDLKGLRKNKVTVGIHPSNYAHYTDFEEFKRQVNSARAAYRDNLGSTPSLFSFPFGEFTNEALHHVKSVGMTAVGQQSGVAHTGLKRHALPRFTMNEFFADETRLNMILNALPLDVRDIYPIETISSDIKKEHTAFGFTAHNGNKNISCYSSGDNPLQIEKIDDTRMEMRSEWRVLDKRVRINCTQTTSNNQVRWFGFLAVR